MAGYALAYDLGTTTLAASLLDPANGRRVAMTGAMNPQRQFGTDVVSRLDAAVTSEQARQQLSLLIRNELFRLAGELLHRTGHDWNDIQRVSLAGNPAMQHFLLELPVRSLAFPPYRPVQTAGIRVTTAELGWPVHLPLYLFPMPGGFVGGDTVAFLYGQLDNRDRAPLSPTLFLDMGTNGEMALLADGNIWSTSAAAGPAFEGGNLSCGMPALAGAISSLVIEGDRVRVGTINNSIPCGICGSAALQAVSLLLEHGIIEPGGRLKEQHELSSNLAARITVHNGETAFVLFRDAKTSLMLTQGDIRQIQLAKGAIRAGMEVLAERACIQFQAIRDVVLTGSFGAVLQPTWLKTIGIFDEVMIHITRFASEGALTGVERALAVDDDYASVESLGSRFRVVPLSGTPRFEDAFMRNIDFPQPHTAR